MATDRDSEELAANLASETTHKAAELAADTAEIARVLAVERATLAAELVKEKVSLAKTLADELNRFRWEMRLLYLSAVVVAVAVKLAG